MKDLLDHILVPKEEERITIPEIEAHPWCATSDSITMSGCIAGAQILSCADMRPQLAPAQGITAAAQSNRMQLRRPASSD